VLGSRNTIIFKLTFLQDSFSLELLCASDKQHKDSLLLAKLSLCSFSEKFKDSLWVFLEISLTEEAKFGAFISLLELSWLSGKKNSIRPGAV